MASLLRAYVHSVHDRHGHMAPGPVAAGG